MIKLEELETAIKLCLWSGWVKNERPISLIIIAEPENGKTEMMKKFKVNKGIVWFTDLTPFGITKAIFPLLESGQIINHIMIPDLLNPLSKSQNTSRAFIQFMNALIEEGICEIQTYAIQVKKTDLQIGLISAITWSGFNSKKTTWKKIGFMSRLLPFSFRYDISVAVEIMNSIYEQGYHTENTVSMEFPKEKVDVQLSKERAMSVAMYSAELAKQIDVYGFRAQKQLQTLLKACALANKRTEVNDDDVQIVMKVARYFNYKRNSIQ